MIETTKEDKRKIKNLKIKETLQKTKERRWWMKIITRDIKLLIRHMTREQRYHLENIFLEAKQYRNTIIANNCEKINHIIRKDWTLKKIKYLSSQMIQSVFKQVKQDIFNLSKSKKKWNKVWRLKFVKEVNCVELKQFWNTFDIKWSRIRIQWIKRRFYTKWLKQLDMNWEISNAMLVKKADWYHLMITNYVNYEKDDYCIHWWLWIDTWMKNQLTLNNWIQIQFEQFKDDDKKIKQKSKRFSKKKEYSRWWKKSKQLLWKAYLKRSRKRKDRINKLRHVFKNTHLFVEDINYQTWQKIWWKKSSEMTLWNFVKRMKHITKINKYYASTKICSKCWNKKDKLWLDVRTYHCDQCWMNLDRDFNASINIFNTWILSNNTKNIDSFIQIKSFNKIPFIKIKSLYISN